MEKETYNELQEKIDSIEAQLFKAKMELESSKRDELSEEVQKFLDRAIDEQAINGMACTFDMTKELQDAKLIFEKLLSPTSDSGKYGLAKDYFNTLQERYKEVERKVAELSQALYSLGTAFKILGQEKTLLMIDNNNDSCYDVADSLNNNDN